MVEYCFILEDLQILFGTVVALMFAVIAILFAVGRAMLRPDIEAKAKTELREIILSIVIGIGIVALAFATCTVSDSIMAEITGVEGMDQFQHSEAYLNLLINKIGIPTVTNMWMLGYMMDLAGSVEVKAFGANILTPIAMLSTSVRTVAGLLFIPFIASLHFQLLSIQASQAFAFTLLLPVGIVLRVIPFTRDAGCFLMAFALGAYVVWPFLFVMNYEISSDVFPELIKMEPGKPVTAEVLKGQPWTVMSEIIGTLFGYIRTGALILPQATVLLIINMSILVGFISIFTEFLKGLK